MSTAIFPATLGFPYRERFRHDTSAAEIPAGVRLLNWPMDATVTTFGSWEIPALPTPPVVASAAWT